MGFEDFLVSLESFSNGREDQQFRAVTAAALLDAIYGSFLKRCPEDVSPRLRQSYLFVSSDNFITSTKEAIESIASASHLEDIEKAGT